MSSLLSAVGLKPRRFHVVRTELFTTPILKLFFLLFFSLVLSV